MNTYNRRNRNYYKRGDVLNVRLIGVHGTSVEQGARPCVVFSNNKSNQYAATLNVYPLTKSIKHNPVHVVISPEDVTGYLKHDSDFLGEQPVTVGVSQVIGKLGHIDEDSELMMQLEQAVARQFAFRFIGKE